MIHQYLSNIDTHAKSLNVLKFQLTNLLVFSSDAWIQTKWWHVSTDRGAKSGCLLTPPTERSDWLQTGAV